MRTPTIRPKSTPSRLPACRHPISSCEYQGEKALDLDAHGRSYADGRWHLVDEPEE
jgi:hypothetical protein